MNTLESLLQSDPHAEAALSPEERALLHDLTAEELELLTHETGQRPDRKGIPTFHVGV